MTTQHVALETLKNELAHRNTADDYLVLLSHGKSLLAEWDHLQRTLNGDADVKIDGQSLRIADVVAVSQYQTEAVLDDGSATVDRVCKSVEFLANHLAQGHRVYGTTTGFGGSADTRTAKTYELQSALLQMQHSGILPLRATHVAKPYTLYLGNALASTAMPEAWVRGSMLLRCNSLARGHSAVRYSIIENLNTFLNNDLVPLVPLRGSISASGDLCPLSYIAGILEGNPDLYVWAGDRRIERHLISSAEALARLDMQPIVFGPKEGLGVLNGTAVSAAVGALALHESNLLAALTQLLTAMCVEAMVGTEESFHDTIQLVRPHSGQIEAAKNIKCFLKGSALSRKLSASPQIATTNDDSGLCQDRYSLRTAPQWIGPCLEDLQLSHKQVSIELNSTTDNPIIDVSGEQILHGGNFQAMAVTSAMEKARLVLQTLGKIMFAQCTEIINPALNNGLPPNLVADEPSLSYTMKGVDINVASYMAELGFLANPVSSHVQSAEMGNQAINSMALVSARYTHAAIDVLSLLAAAHLYVLCQALDLRVMQINFMRTLKPQLRDLTIDAFQSCAEETELEELYAQLWNRVALLITDTANMDSEERFKHIAESATPILITFLLSRQMSVDRLLILQDWVERATALCRNNFVTTRQQTFKEPITASFLGVASKRMYNFVRKELGVPFHKGLADHPTFMGRYQAEQRTTGSNISIIYEALRDGRLYAPVMECLREVQQGAKHENENEVAQSEFNDESLSDVQTEVECGSPNSVARSEADPECIRETQKEEKEVTLRSIVSFPVGSTYSIPVEVEANRDLKETLITSPTNVERLKDNTAELGNETTHELGTNNDHLTRNKINENHECSEETDSGVSNLQKPEEIRKIEGTLIISAAYKSTELQEEVKAIEVAVKEVQLEMTPQIQMATVRSDSVTVGA